jgi:hypothetical protein
MRRDVKRFGWLVLWAAWLASGVAAAADAGPARAAVVEGVQLPAWLERGGDRLPLAIGAALQARDRVVTGEGARLLLRMPEGSLVKLGENGMLDLEALSRTGTLKDELVQATLAVARGAFRFTTDKLPAFVGRREVDIRISAVTAGIRGTDLWGKSDAERDIVCLIEGRISVRREGDAAFTMDQALSFYVAPKGRAAEPVAPVDRRQLGLWAAETEIEDGKGVLRRGGRWRLTLLDTADER